MRSIGPARFGGPAEPVPAPRAASSRSPGPGDPDLVLDQPFDVLTGQRREVEHDTVTRLDAAAQLGELGAARGRGGAAETS
jgi:hypothetical protein